MSKPKAAVSWTGGKDTCLALYSAISTFDVRASQKIERAADVMVLRPQVLARLAST